MDTVGNTEENEGTMMTVGQEGCRKAAPLLEAVHLKDHLATNPSEYSYFDMNRVLAWAGPNHWRVKPLSKVRTVAHGEDLKRKKKSYVTLDYDDMDLGVYFKSTRASTKLSLSTIKNWNSTKTTLPIDLHYDVRNFTKLHGRPAIVIRRQSKGASVEDSVSNYNYNNPIDRDNYCADVEDCISPYCDQTVGYDMTKIFSQTIVDSTSLNGDITQLGSSGDLLDNLVAAPNKVAKINIGYARQAKRIDMKKLKSVMWSMLADFPSPNKENEKGLENHAQPVEDSEDKMDLEQSVEFSQLYRILPSRLSAKMSENLSVSLAFIALLHLANERNLKLTSEGELRDFIVSQG